MWELSISVSTKNLDVAKFVYQTLKKQAQQLGAVVTCYEEFDNIYIIFGCPVEEKGRSSVAIERCVVKAITNFYKEKFLSENLKLPVFDEINLTAFKQALINFDKETDFYIIGKNLQLNENLHLDSFYAFKLKSLRDKWAELIALANENSEYLTSNEAFLDLLKFLIDNLEIGEEEVNVFEDENGYFFGSKENEIHENMSQNTLVSSLIDICPKKINFFCKSDDAVVNFLSKIFEERINVCYNKNLEKLENFSILK